MANRGKFTDRSPCMPAAGLVSPWSKVDMGRCFEHDMTPEEERVQLLQREGRGEPLDHLVPPGRADIYRGFDTDARRCLQPEADRGLGLAATLTDELRDTVYSSYWNRPLGRVADQTPGLPEGEGPLDRTHGTATDGSHGAGELINPPKTYAEVMAEAAVGHDMYRKTHADYDPGEQTSRCYGRPFREGLVWGKPTPCDPHGGCAKKVVSSDTDRKILVSKILADFKKRTEPLIGKVLAPNDNASRVPRDHAYGRLNRRSVIGAGELLSEGAVSLDRLDMLEELAYVNHLRGQLNKRRPPVSHRDLEDAFHERDPTGSGFLPADEVHRILADRQINPHKSLFDRFLKRMNVLSEDGRVVYKKVIDVLNVNVEFPELSKIKDVPDKFLHFETTNQLAYKYHCDRDAGESAAAVAAAGSPARPHEGVGALLGPSAFTACGIHPRRFFEPRSPQYIRALVDGLGHQLDDAAFDSLWNLAQDSNGCVTVQRVLNVLNS